jgi:hypothetical protein
MQNLDFVFKKSHNSRRGNYLGKGRGLGKRIRESNGGEYDQTMLYACMKMSS